MNVIPIMKNYDKKDWVIWRVAYITIMAFGLVLLGISLRTHLMLADLQRVGEMTQGVTVDIDTYRSSGRSGGTSVKVRTVQYAVGGETYVANMAARGGMGESVDVVYDPAKPWRAASADSVENVSVAGYFERNIVAFICLIGGVIGLTRQKQKKTG